MKTMKQLCRYIMKFSSQSAIYDENGNKESTKLHNLKDDNDFIKNR